MAAIDLHVLLPALLHERIEVALLVDARMHVAIDDAQPCFRGGLFFEDGAVDDVTHAILLFSSISIEETFPADCRRTCARRCFAVDAAASDRHRRTASADSRTRTGTFFPNQSGRSRLRPPGHWAAHRTAAW